MHETWPLAMYCLFTQTSSIHLTNFNKTEKLNSMIEIKTMAMLIAHISGHTFLENVSLFIQTITLNINFNIKEPNSNYENGI